MPLTMMSGFGVVMLARASTVSPELGTVQLYSYNTAICGGGGGRGGGARGGACGGGNGGDGGVGGERGGGPGGNMTTGSETLRALASTPRLVARVAATVLALRLD